MKSFTSIDVWKTILLKFIKFITPPSSTRIKDAGECVAKEVFLYKEPAGYFSTSPKPRAPRPPKVAYRVGQVIKHKKWGYRGVIVGWDEKAKVCTTAYLLTFASSENSGKF